MGALPLALPDCCPDGKKVLCVCAACFFAVFPSLLTLTEGLSEEHLGRGSCQRKEPGMSPGHVRERASVVLLSMLFSGLFFQVFPLRRLF